MIALTRPGNFASIVEFFALPDSNPAATPMEENLKLSVKMLPVTPEDHLSMKSIPYRELVGKLLYLTVATRPDIAYAVGVLCRFVENVAKVTVRWVDRVV